MLCDPLAFRKDDSPWVDLVTLPCNRWSCERCGPRRQRKAQKEFLAGRPDKLVTFTVGTADGKSPLEHRAIIAVAFPKFMRLLCRKIGVRLIAYWCVIEIHESGHPHLHTGMRLPKVDKAWLQFTWKSLTGSHNVDIEAVRGRLPVAKYLSKYLTKDAIKFGNFKRYWMSRNWKLEEVEKPKREKLCRADGWHKTGRSYENEVQSLVMAHYSWYRSSGGINRFCKPGCLTRFQRGPP